MNLYLITQEENQGHDTYDSAVVAAESEQQARGIFPNTRHAFKEEEWFEFGWASSPDNVKAVLIGVAKDGTEPGSICASFNAG